MNDMSAISTGHVASMQRLLEDPAAFVEMLPLAVCICDDVGRILAFNRRAAALWGRAPHPNDTCESFFGAMPGTMPAGAPSVSISQMISDALRSGNVIEGRDVFIHRPSMVAARATLHVQPVRDEDGCVIGGVNCFHDVTEQHNDRDWANARHKTMVDELNHRVKNTLATVQSLAAQTLRAPQVSKEVRGMFEARLFTLSRAHDHLTRAHWKSVDLKAIAEEIFLPYRYLGQNRIRLDGASVAIAAHAAITLSMVLHELAANAVKYGALLGATGYVDVGWSTVRRVEHEPNGGERLVLTWAEHGGPPVEKPLGRGFGSRLLQNGIVQGLKGVTEMMFEPHGLQCIIDIPLPLVQGRVELNQMGQGAP